MIKDSWDEAGGGRSTLNDINIMKYLVSFEKIRLTMKLLNFWNLIQDNNPTGSTKKWQKKSPSLHLVFSDGPSLLTNITRNPKLWSPKRFSSPFKKVDLPSPKRSSQKSKKILDKFNNIWVNSKKSSPSNKRPKINWRPEPPKLKRRLTLSVNWFILWPEKKKDGTKEETHL